MIDKLIDIILERQETYKSHEKDEPKYAKLREKSSKAILDYKENKTEEDEKKIIDNFIEYFWNWVNYDSMTEYNEDESGYVSPALCKKMTEKSSEIFHYLFKDSKNMDKKLLKEKYTFLVETFWEDLSFLFFGIRSKDEDDGKFKGYFVPYWVKKGLNDEEKEQLKKCNLNQQDYCIPRNEMYCYMDDLLK